MPKPKRHLHDTVNSTLTPPAALPPTHHIARITRAAGNNLYSCVLAGAPDKEMLAELHAKFRNTIYVKRGTYVVVDTAALAERENKLEGEIVNVVRDEKEWRKMGYWPPEFVKKSAYPEDSDEEESTVGKMPPSDSESEG